MTIEGNTGRDTDARALALDLLRDGEATVSEAAALAGVDRQLVHYWASAAGIDPTKARQKRLARTWRARVAKSKGAAKPKPNKAEQRAQGEKAVQAFNKKRRSRQSQ